MHLTGYRLLLATVASRICLHAPARFGWAAPTAMGQSRLRTAPGGTDAAGWFMALLLPLSHRSGLSPPAVAALGFRPRGLRVQPPALVTHAALPHYKSWRTAQRRAARAGEEREAGEVLGNWGCAAVCPVPTRAVVSPAEAFPSLPEEPSLPQLPARCPTDAASRKPTAITTEVSHVNEGSWAPQRSIRARQRSGEKRAGRETWK